MTKKVVFVWFLSVLGLPAIASAESSAFTVIYYWEHEIPDPRIGSALRRYFPAASKLKIQEGEPADLAPNLSLPEEIGSLTIRFLRNPNLEGHAGSFSLEVSARPLTAKITYRDLSGAFYALRKLTGLVRNQRVTLAKIIGKPSFPWRGVREGFYGRPWSWEQRRDFLNWMAENRMNLFVLAPKDEESLRQNWRRPLNDTELKALKNFHQAAQNHFIELAWTLNPMDARALDPVDVEAAVHKYQSVLGLGIRKLVLAFDGTQPDPGQVEFANRVLRALSASYRDLDFTFIPAQYWGDTSSDYLKSLATGLDAQFRVYWTGPQAVSRSISQQDAEHFSRFIQHRLTLGDNYPAQDYLLDFGRLFLGPLVGREPGLASFHEAWISNASPLAEASKIPLYTAADFAWNATEYDAARSWNAALENLGGSKAVALKLFARENIFSGLPLSPGIDDYGLKDMLETYSSGMDSKKLRALLGDLRRIHLVLEPGLSYNPELLREIQPWVRKLSAQSEAALLALDLLEARLSRGSQEAGKIRFLALKREAERNPALISDLALDRFLSRAEARLAGLPEQSLAPLVEQIRIYCQEESNASALDPALEFLTRTPQAFQAAMGSGEMRPEEAQWAGELIPWIDLLAEQAARARLGLSYRGNPLFRLAWIGCIDDFVRKWKIRLRFFLPLWASQRLMQDFFEDLDALRGGKPKSAQTMPLLLKSWLWLRARTHPSSFPVILSRHLEAYRRSGDSSGLETAFGILKAMPDRLRAKASGSLTVEIWPWADRVGEYGSLGIQALELRRRFQEERKALKGWGDWNQRLRQMDSMNGLDFCLQLKIALESFWRRQRLPPPYRPKGLNLDLPPDLAEIL